MRRSASLAPEYSWLILNIGWWCSLVLTFIYHLSSIAFIVVSTYTTYNQRKATSTLLLSD